MTKQEINNNNKSEVNGNVSQEQENDPLAKKPSHYKRPTIFYSRIWTLAAAFIILFSPILIAVYYHAGPNWAAVVGGLLAVVPIYWPVTIIEQFTYTPLLGPSATMLSLVTGNLTNMKIPAALSALEKYKAQPGSETGKIICLLACSTCALVSIIVCCLGVAGLSFMKPVLDNPVLSPAFSNLLPALFGSLCVTFFKKDWKIAILPCSVMVFLFICFPFLSKLGGLLVPVAIIISVAGARIMFKQGLLDDDKDRNKIELWTRIKAFCTKYKKMIRFVTVPVVSLVVIAALVLTFAGQVSTSPFAVQENGKPVTIQQNLHEIWFDKDYKYDYDAASKYLQNAYPVNSSSQQRCLSMTNNGLFGHNYDWIKDSVDEYIVHVQESSDRFSSIGVASSPVSSYSKKPTIDPNTTDSDAIASIPFCLVDGINQNGVYCAINRASNYDNLNTSSGIQTKPGAEEINSMCVPRYVLDKCKSADDALMKLKNLNIISNADKVHFMIGDAYRYYVVEVSSGKTTIVVDNVMSNFDLSETNSEIYSTGLERYNLASEKINEVITSNNMMYLLRECRYSKMFSTDNNPIWYSDLYDIAVNNGNITWPNSMSSDEIKKTLDDFIVNHNLTFFNTYPQGTEVCTLHSVVYDAKTKRMYLTNQENVNVYEFSLSGMVDNGTNTIDMFSSLGS